MAQVARRGFGKARFSHSLPAEATTSTSTRLATINPEMEIRSDMSFNTRSSVGVAIIGERNKLNGELSDLSKTKKHLLEQIERERLQLLNEQRRKGDEARQREEEAERRMQEEEQEEAKRKDAVESGLRRSDSKVKSYVRVCSLGDNTLTKKPRSIMKLKRLTTKEMDRLMDRSTEPKHDRVWWLEQNRKMEAQRHEARLQEIANTKSKFAPDQTK